MVDQLYVQHNIIHQICKGHLRQPTKGPQLFPHASCKRRWHHVRGTYILLVSTETNSKTQNNNDILSVAVAATADGQKG